MPINGSEEANENNELNSPKQSLNQTNGVIEDSSGGFGSAVEPVINNQQSEPQGFAFKVPEDSLTAQSVADESNGAEMIVSDDVLVIEDDSDLGNNTFYVQEGVYLDEKTDEVIIDESLFEGMTDDEGFFTLDTGRKDENGKKVTKKVKAKKMKRKEKRTFRIGTIEEDNFGDLLPYIRDVDVTDINWNGMQLWIDDVNKGRYLSDVVLTKDFIDVLSIRVADVVSATFNKYHPTLEAETEELRLTIVHESVSHTGRAISIRKTPAMKRINFWKSIDEGSYCTREVANLMSNFVKAKFNIVVCGLPGVGKTELVKFLTNYIAPHDRVITVEDTLEIHYSKINPGKDCLELKVGRTFSYTDAIKESLRLLPQWVLLSEARSTEVQYLLESVSTGTKCITTIHTDDVRKIPDRVVHMIGNNQSTGMVLESVYNFFNVGILIDKRLNPETKRIERFISQIGVFDRSDGNNACHLLVDNKQPTGTSVPIDMQRKMEMIGITDPWQYTKLNW